MLKRFSLTFFICVLYTTSARFHAILNHMYSFMTREKRPQIPTYLIIEIMNYSPNHRDSWYFVMKELKYNFGTCSFCKSDNTIIRMIPASKDTCRSICKQCWPLSKF